MKYPLITILSGATALSTTTASLTINTQGPQYSRWIEVILLDKEDKEKTIRLQLDDIDNIAKAELKADSDQKWSTISDDKQTKLATIASYFIQVQHRKNVLSSKGNNESGQQQTNTNSHSLTNIDGIYSGKYTAPLMAFIKLSEKKFDEVDDVNVKVKGTIAYGEIDYYYRHTEPSDKKYQYSKPKEYADIKNEHQKLNNGSSDSNSDSTLESSKETLDQIKNKVKNNSSS